MSDRGLTLLQILHLPPNSAERASAWEDFARTYRNGIAERVLVEYAGRRFATSDDYRTAELTPVGEIRRQQGLDLRARRD